jgi:hypothetical protein
MFFLVSYQQNQHKIFKIYVQNEYFPQIRCKVHKYADLLR